MWKTPAVLIVIVLSLLGFGIVMLASTSAIKALASYDDPHYFVKRQLIWLILALVVGLFAGRIDYHRWRFLALPLLVLTVLLLTMVLIPGIGLKIGGSRRWLHFSHFNFQPSELCKFTLVLSLAWWMAREQRHVKTFVRGALIPCILMGVILGLVFKEPDYGTTILCGAVGVIIMFLGGARLLYLGAFSAVGLTGITVALMHNELRLQRLLAFREPEKYAETFAYQLIKSIEAFILGGGTGVGFGASMQKHYYLPEAHTDFIFAIIGEELGVAATLAVLFLFAGLFFCGLRISWRAPDMFGRLLAFGIALMIALQALLNMAVVTGCMPTKGLPLPLISYGGSSLLITLLGVGVLFNIARHAGEEYRDEDSRIVKDRVHAF